MYSNYLYVLQPPAQLQKYLYIHTTFVLNIICRPSIWTSNFDLKPLDAINYYSCIVL